MVPVYLPNSVFFKYFQRNIISLTLLQGEVTSNIRKRKREKSQRKQKVVKEKKRHGERGVNKLPSSVSIVTRLTENGEPEEPAEAVKAWRRVCGFYVRELVPITCRDWKRLDDDKKNELWTKIKQYIKFPKGTKKIAKKATLVSCGVKFRRWKAELNINFVKKNLMPK